MRLFVVGLRSADISMIQNTAARVFRGGFDLLSMYACVGKPYTHTHTHAAVFPAVHNSTIIQPIFNPPCDRDLEFMGAAAVHRAPPASSGDLMPALPALIDYLQARHGGPHPLLCILSPSCFHSQRVILFPLMMPGRRAPRWPACCAV